MAWDLTIVCQRHIEESSSNNSIGWPTAEEAALVVWLGRVVLHSSDMLNTKGTNKQAVSERPSGASINACSTHSSAVKSCVNDLLCSVSAVVCQGVSDGNDLSDSADTQGEDRDEQCKRDGQPHTAVPVACLLLATRLQKRTTVSRTPERDMCERRNRCRRLDEAKIDTQCQITRILDTPRLLSEQLMHAIITHLIIYQRDVPETKAATGKTLHKSTAPGRRWTDI